MKLIELPVELHQNVSSFLSQTDLYALARTCRQLHNVCYPILWEAISFIDQFPTFGIDPSAPYSNGPQLASSDICYACTISAPRPVTITLIASKFRCYHNPRNSFRGFLDAIENNTIREPTCRLVKVISIFDVRGTDAMAKLIARLARHKPRSYLGNVTNVQLFVTNSSVKPIDLMARFLRPTDKFFLIQDTNRNPMQLTRLIANKTPGFFYTLRWLDISVGSENSNTNSNNHGNNNSISIDNDDEEDINFVNGLLEKMVNLEFLCISNRTNSGSSRFKVAATTFAALTKLVRFKVSGEIVTTLNSFRASDLLPVTTSVKFDLSLQDDTTTAYMAYLEECIKHMDDGGGGSSGSSSGNGSDNKTNGAGTGTGKGKGNKNHQFLFQHIESCSFLWSHVGSWNQIYNSRVSVKFWFPNVTKLELWLAKYEQEKDLIRACPKLKTLILKEISLQSLKFIQETHPQLTSLSFSMVTPESSDIAIEQRQQQQKHMDGDGGAGGGAPPVRTNNQRLHLLSSLAAAASQYTILLLTTIQQFRNLEFLAIGYQEVLQATSTSTSGGMGSNSSGTLTGEDFFKCLRECDKLAQVALMIPTKGFYSARSKLYRAYKADESGIMAFFTEGRYIYIGKLCYNALYLDVPNFKRSMAEEGMAVAPTAGGSTVSE